MPLLRALVTAIFLFWCVPIGLVTAAQPCFELVPLGVFGGEIESNSSCFLLRHPGGAGPGLMLDCGSPVSGILRWKGLDTGPQSWHERMTAVNAVLKDVPAYFLTHSHLDHLYGFVLQSPLHLDGVMKGTTTTIWGNANTVQAIRESLFNGRVWGDFTRVPSKDSPAFRLGTLQDGTAVEAAGFQVEGVPLKHPSPCTAMLVTEPGGRAYLHLGDTGASQAVWERARPLLRAGKLAAIAVETSFASRQEKLAVLTGHLTPASLVRELGKLTGSVPQTAVTTQDGAASPTMKSALEAAPGVGRALAGVRLLIHHIKPSSYDEVVLELNLLRAAGLPVEVLEQGKPLMF